MKKKGIKFELNANISSIKEEKNTVQFVNNKNHETSDALIVSIGVIPNLDEEIINNTRIKKCFYKAMGIRHSL